MLVIHKTRRRQPQIVRFVHSWRKPSTIDSKKVRQLFLDYYVKNNDYNFVKSSPVVPFHDATVPFVNSGMNQFKGIFLNNQSPQFAKVANYQKCIRISGKHNDFETVGMDGYHHTFFEMLGTWTFKQCSKEEQCSLAWKLLTDIYKINQNQLFVTYFQGDEKHSLPADVECREIWRKLGVPYNRILAFGMQENFWEMGATGPCGPCTEIHFDHSRAPHRAQFVNKGLHELIELWNIVFIEYNRDLNSKITPLPHKHVDTGMGFERLVAVLQQKTSNYDSDIFHYLFHAIFKNCKNIPQYKSIFGEHDWNGLNTNYRILADHTRMITISLADGMIPEQNQKLRKVLRKAFHISETVFKKPRGLLKELSNYVINHLGPIYPELEANVKQIQQIIEYEESVYQELRKSATCEWSKMIADNPKLSNLDILEMPGLLHAYKDLKTSEIHQLDPKFAYKLHDTYGIDEVGIDSLCQVLDIKFNHAEFENKVELMRMQSKAGSLVTINQIQGLNDQSLCTDDSFKYDFQRTSNGYKFPSMRVKVLKIVQNNVVVPFVHGSCDCALILDKTNLYHESGGQLDDEGCIIFENGEFHVKNLKKINNYILHFGTWQAENTLNASSEGVLSLNESKRIAHMQNHTAIHLLNALIKQVKGATCQKSSKVTEKYLNFDVGIFSEKLTIDELKLIEDKMNAIIQDKINVIASQSDSQNLLQKNVTLIPGEIYPDSNIRMIEINCNDFLISREPCCGTHVINTNDLESFTFVRMKSLGRSTVSLYALTGKRALKAQKVGAEMLSNFQTIEKDIKSLNALTLNELEQRLSQLRNRLSSNLDDDSIIPFIIHQECEMIYEKAAQCLKDVSKTQMKEHINVEMKSAVETKILTSDQENKFIVHYLHTHFSGVGISLQKATNLVTDIPVMVISCADNVVKARCTVPEMYKRDEFTAEKWMQVVSDVFKSSVQPPKGQNKEFVCNLKGKKIKDAEWQILLDQSLKAAELYAKKYL